MVQWHRVFVFVNYAFECFCLAELCLNRKKTLLASEYGARRVRFFARENVGAFGYDGGPDQDDVSNQQILHGKGAKSHAADCEGDSARLEDRPRAHERGRSAGAAIHIEFD